MAEFLFEGKNSFGESFIQDANLALAEGREVVVPILWDNQADP